MDEPWDELTGRGPGIALCFVLVSRKVANRGPDPHVFWISSEFFESEGSVWSRENVDATISLGRLVAGQHGPGSVEPL